MTKRHQASRRRTYGRRQHELHERPERYLGVLGWVEDSEIAGRTEPTGRWTSVPLVQTAAGHWLADRGIG